MSGVSVLKQGHLASFCRLKYPSLSLSLPVIMAEAAGLVVGIMPLLAQAAIQIDKLNEIRNTAKEAPAEQNSLLEEVNLVLHLRDRAKRPSRHLHEYDEKISNHFRKGCSQLVNDLEVLNEKLQARERGRTRNPAKLLGFRHWKDDAQRRRETISMMKLDFIL